MPHPDGMDVLRWKQQQIFPTILWIATSNFDGVRTINEAYSAGATTFLTKPLDAADVRNLLDAFEEYWVLAGTERSEFVSDFAGLKASVFR
jgi:DNA-binding NtrC family response regulator